MAQAELNHVSTLVIIAICIVHCSKSIDGQAGAASSSGSAPARLEVDAATPMPSPGAQIGLRAAYALARRNGLTRADHVSLSLSTKDPKAPLVLWTFQGEHTQQDSQAIHIDALTGALVDEDRMSDLTRAERDTLLFPHFNFAKRRSS